MGSTSEIAGGDADGRDVLATINAIRAVSGASPLSGLRLAACRHCHQGCLECAIHRATGAVIADGAGGRFVFRFACLAEAVRVAEATGADRSTQDHEVPLRRSLDSLVIADAFDLTLRRSDGLLKGWIEPGGERATSWELHLLPGNDYPPGTARAQP